LKNEGDFTLDKFWWTNLPLGIPTNFFLTVLKNTPVFSGTTFVQPKIFGAFCFFVSFVSDVFSYGKIPQNFSVAKFVERKMYKL
jgi:hypothetical protein